MSTTSVPPRFVPTLTDVVPASQHGYANQFETAPSLHLNAGSNVGLNTNAYLNSTASAPGTANPARPEDLLVKRVMQQVDVVLERRLREALGRVILEQTEALAPKLRSEIEQVVKESIGQAFAQEMPDRQG